jgi:hypothetical protein
MKGHRVTVGFVRSIFSIGTLLLCSSPAVAAPDITMPEECGSAASFETELRSRVGEHTDEILRKTVLFIDKDGDEYRLAMRVGDERRTLRDPSCPHLFMAAVVVAVSLVEGPHRDAGPAIADGAPGATPTPSPTAAPQTEPPQTTQAPSPKPPPPRAPEPEHAHGSGLGLGVGAGIGTSFGFLPGPSLAIELGTSLHLPPWGVAVRGRYFADASQRDVEGRGVHVQAAGAEMSAFWDGLGFLELRVGMNARAAIGSGIGSPSTREDTAWSFAPIVGARAIPFALGNARVVLGADAALDLTRPEFEITQYGEVFRASLVDGAVFLGGEYLFR